MPDGFGRFIVGIKATQEGEQMEIIDDSPSDEGLKPTLDEEILRQRKGPNPHAVHPT